MFRILLSVLCVCWFVPAALAQEADSPPVFAPLPELPLSETLPSDSEPDLESGLEPEPEASRKDLTVRSEAARQIMLDDLFQDLQDAGSPQDAELIAEEIWAVFLQSRSASVDFLLLRGIAAQNAGNTELARAMYDHVTALSPQFAEGWSRSGRLAFEQDDLPRAVSDTLQALVYEPRHFFALWTLGNILEKLQKTEDAADAYGQAHSLYPQHEEIKARYEYLQNAFLGPAL